MIRVRFDDGEFALWVDETLVVHFCACTVSLAVHGWVKLEGPRIADSSSRNAVSFSSARTTKRFPSSRCASAIQIVRPL